MSELGFIYKYYILFLPLTPSRGEHKKYPSLEGSGGGNTDLFLEKESYYGTK